MSLREEFEARRKKAEDHYVKYRGGDALCDFLAGYDQGWQAHAESVAALKHAIDVIMRTTEPMCRRSPDFCQGLPEKPNCPECEERHIALQAIGYSTINENWKAESLSGDAPPTLETVLKVVAEQLCRPDFTVDKFIENVRASLTRQERK